MSTEALAGALAALRGRTVTITVEAGDGTPGRDRTGICLRAALRPADGGLEVYLSGGQFVALLPHAGREGFLVSQPAETHFVLSLGASEPAAPTEAPADASAPRAVMFGKLVGAVRRELGLDVVFVADRAGVAAATLRRLEAGLAPAPDADAVDRIADAVELSRGFAAAIAAWERPAPAGSDR